MEAIKLHWEQKEKDFNGEKISYHGIANWQQLQQQGANAFWAKLWPSSEALCQFLIDNIVLIQDKNVLELAAGLGLPSLVSAKYAKAVVCTDLFSEAVEGIKKSIVLNKLENVQAQVWDWHYYPTMAEFDVLIASDINYDPNSFEMLHKLFFELLHQGKTIIISTPQRLVAKQFILPLLPYAKMQQHSFINREDESTGVSVFVLQQ